MTAKRPLVLFIALSLLTISFPLLAQEDSVTIAYSEEPAESSDFSLRETYKYWTRANVEEKSMFKIGISDFGFGGNFGPTIGYRVAYERKIGVPFSFIGQYRHLMNGWQSNALGLDFGVRYYYALPRRIGKGKSANNLSANYFSIQNDNTWGGVRDLLYLRPITFSDIYTTSTHSVSLLYGLQRRLGKHGYIDVNFGYTYYPEFKNMPPLRSGYFDGNFSIGVAF